MNNHCQFHRMAQRVILLGFASVVLTACSEGKDRVSLDPTENFHQALKAASGPFEDLNLTRDEIPPLLKAIARNPYAPPPADCATIKTQVADLDALLGPDIQGTDTQITFVSDNSDEGLVSSMKELPNLPSTPTLVNKGVGAAQSGLMSFIHKQTEILPFRSIIRKVSGADRHQSRLQAAANAGQMRRAFLKGMAQAKFGDKCLSPVIEAKAEGTEVAAIH